MASVMKSVAIIGGGPSGLAACKSAVEENLVPTVFEAGSGVGGLWCGNTSGKTWGSLRTNLSKFTCAFSDRPWREDFPDFPGASQVRDYLVEYAEANSLLQHVQLRTKVTNLERDTDGGWKVTWAAVSDSTSREETQTFDFVIVATGIFSKPHYPSLPGMDKFLGELAHAAEYREPEVFSGKKVLVVGAAFSGADIAAEIAGCAASVAIAARRPLWYLPRYVNGKPADLVFYSRAGTDRAKGASEEESALNRHRFFASLVGTPPASLNVPDPQRGDLPFVAITDNFLDAVRSNRVAVRSAGVAGFEETAVVFDNGHREDFDVVLFATGYRLDLPFLPTSAHRILDFQQDDWLQPVILHECVWHPELPALAFVGLYRGPYFAVMELQARWACGVFSGRLPQPTKEETEMGLKKEHEIRGKRPRPQFPHGDYVSMAESLAHHVGVHPEHILQDESSDLRPLLYEGPLLPFHFRLVGFGSKPDIAESAIRDCVAQYPISNL